MWRLTFVFFVGMFVTAMFTNAIAVYLLHDVDADRVGQWGLAYWGLTLEFFVFALLVSAAFLVLTGLGRLLLGLRNVPVNIRLGLVLSVVVILIQYPAEFTIRQLNGGSSDAFLLGYLLLSPVFCASVTLLDQRKRCVPLTLNKIS